MLTWFRSFGPNDSVNGYLIGTGWRKLTSQEKVFYLSGIEHGLGLAAEHVGDEGAFDALKVPGARFSEIARDIDDFYALDARNMAIPAALGYTWAIKRRSGASREEVESFVQTEQSFWGQRT